MIRLGRHAVAELARTVVPPAADTTALLHQRAGVGNAHGDRLCTGENGSVRRLQAIHLQIGIVADLSPTIVSPAADATVPRERAREVEASGHCCCVGLNVAVSWLEDRVVAADPELAVDIVTPATNASVLEQRARVDVARRD